ncbi:hypothetical protein [Marinithermofilum abyssi]|uniref:hypothetical protein n=1 Tax=Marinithermofilum abyssi TaxID=1571185 RepID=UPI00166799DB|nr:hypothetical protein [Marinithermofilum abyssi]
MKYWKEGEDLTALVVLLCVAAMLGLLIWTIQLWFAYRKSEGDDKVLVHAKIQYAIGGCFAVMTTYNLLVEGNYLKVGLYALLTVSIIAIGIHKKKSVSG